MLRKVFLKVLPVYNNTLWPGFYVIHTYIHTKRFREYVVIHFIATLTELMLLRDAIIIFIKMYIWKFRNTLVTETKISLLLFLLNMQVDYISKAHLHVRWDCKT